VEPPEDSWERLERRLFRGSEVPSAADRALGWWRRFAVGFGALAAGLLASLIYLSVGQERPQCYAVLTDERQVPTLVVFDRRNMKELVALPVGPRLAQADGLAQLWIVAAGKTVPVGTLRPDRETRLALDKAMSTAVMADDARLLVTIEPAGGATSGVPSAQRLGEGSVALLGPPPRPST
jgi:anti-sigma-K factor RskA